jgi:hypothetical protein
VARAASAANHRFLVVPTTALMLKNETDQVFVEVAVVRP